MPECHNCGAHVTRQFARVFGDNNDQVHGCQDCITSEWIHEGFAARPQG